MSKWTQNFFFLGLLLTLKTTCCADMQNAKEEGKALGNQGTSQAVSQIRQFPSQDLLSEKERGKSFDPEKAKENSEGTQILDYLQSKEVQDNINPPQEEDHLLIRSENLAEKADRESIEVEEISEFSIQTCKQSDAPYPLSVIRNLNVEVVEKPAEIKEVNICQGHEEREIYTKKKEAQKAKKKWEDKLSQDPTVKTYNVTIYKKGKWRVKPSWVHHDDVHNCNNYQTQLVTVKESNLQESRLEEVGDHWIYEDEKSLTQSRTPNCTYLKRECLDSSPSKTINGKEVKRKCWREKLTFLCQLANPQTCPWIKDQNCELIKKECLQEGPLGCTLWELTFKCYSKVVRRRISNEELFGLDEEHEYEPNDSFSEIAAKLAVFEEMKKELEGSQESDARKVQVFKGQRRQCSKSIADEILYDCCFAYSGIAKELGLKTCSAEEMALAEMREEGLCHYVGTYDGKFLDLWKSRDEHVFCCFGTKLAKILQENARDQMSIGWQKPKHADCRGLSLDEISKLNFSKMDFSELYSDYEKKLPERFQEKLDRFADRIKKEVEVLDEKSK